ncbi:MAG: collagenase [Bacteroidetes bacterium CG2_30_32_10]|nr:MAG: collagenase [Bacteroidetes bacterium CG2_30_32_10]
MNHHSKIELMSPVGSYESLMAAIQAKADAVYFGVEQLNMRSRSSANFKLEDIENITAICKENGVRSYLTLNTVIYDNEIDLVKSIIDKSKACGISAIIASDISVINYARSIDMEIHISTQCNITNIDAVKFYAAYSDVMVTARELSLKQVGEIVKQIKNENINGPSGNLVKIEVFAHGALCMAVSGKCYLSLDNLNYSANRGACMQLCRRSYVVTDKDSGIELEVDNEFIMSPKDLSTIAFLDKIIDAGVCVLKIEGRGRAPEYVKTVTSCYREAIDAYYAGNYTQLAIDNWTARLKSVYNRGFWEGYYLGKKLGEWSEQYGSQATKKKTYIGKVTNYFSKLKVAEIKIETYSLQVGDEVLIIGPTTGVVEEQIKEIRVDLKKTDETVKGEVCSFSLSQLVRRGDQLYKFI